LDRQRLTEDTQEEKLREVQKCHLIDLREGTYVRWGFRFNEPLLDSKGGPLVGGKGRRKVSPYKAEGSLVRGKNWALAEEKRSQIQRGGGGCERRALWLLRVLAGSNLVVIACQRAEGERKSQRGKCGGVGGGGDRVPGSQSGKGKREKKKGSECGADCSKNPEKRSGFNS